MINPRRGIAGSQSKFFERSGELTRGMLMITDLALSMNQIFDAVSPEVILEDSIRIVEITYDQIEACEMICKFCW